METGRGQACDIAELPPAGSEGCASLPDRRPPSLTFHHQYVAGVAVRLRGGCAACQVAQPGACYMHTTRLTPRALVQCSAAATTCPVTALPTRQRALRSQDPLLMTTHALRAPRSTHLEQAVQQQHAPVRLADAPQDALGGQALGGLRQAAGSGSGQVFQWVRE